jgi:hypothetical protein
MAQMAASEEAAGGTPLANGQRQAPPPGSAESIHSSMPW